MRAGRRGASLTTHRPGSAQPPLHPGICRAKAFFEVCQSCRRGALSHPDRWRKFNWLNCLNQRHLHLPGNYSHALKKSQVGQAAGAAARTCPILLFVQRLRERFANRRAGPVMAPVRAPYRGHHWPRSPVRNTRWPRSVRPTGGITAPARQFANRSKREREVFTSAAGADEAATAPAPAPDD